MCRYIIICIEKGKGLKKFIRDLAEQGHAHCKNNTPCCPPCNTRCADHEEAYQANVSEQSPPQKSKIKGPRTIRLEDVPPDAELCSITDACGIIGISRTTLRADRDEGYLTDIKKGNRDVRLFREEVERLRKWYAFFKGKS